MQPNAQELMPEHLFSLKGKTAFVTGAGGGLGKEVGAADLRSGANVAIADLRASALEAAQKELSVLGSVSAHPCDVTEMQSVGAAVDGALQRFGKIDILFSAGGLGRGTSG